MRDDFAVGRWRPLWPGRSTRRSASGETSAPQTPPQHVLKRTRVGGVWVARRIIQLRLVARRHRKAEAVPPVSTQQQLVPTADSTAGEAGPR